MRIALPALLLALALPAQAAEVTGQAFYRERIALPPGAVFEAVLEDVSRADAPAVEIARDAGADRAGPPFAFALPYDPARIDSAATYAVRAAIRHDGRLLFASDTFFPAITQGAPIELEIPMIRVVNQAEGPAPGMRGGVIVFADAPRFLDCATGVSRPIAMEADFPALERAVLARRADPMEPLTATFEGEIAERPRMEGEGTEEAVIVTRFAAVWPGLACEQALADADLAETYWRILQIDGQDVPSPQGQAQEPHMILRAEEPRTFSATVGCNQMMGGYRLEPDGLAFGPVAGTMMACPEQLAKAETALTKALEGARSWRIIGPGLELFDAEGRRTGLFEAVYLR